jgi:hypothetical protein
LYLKSRTDEFQPPTSIDCTFLGPSRKRGPPKGYIDAIEARLHQTEALVGILLAVNDSRASSLLDDLSQVMYNLLFFFDSEHLFDLAIIYSVTLGPSGV